MSFQTAKAKEWIAEVRNGDLTNLPKLRRVVEGLGKSSETPPLVIAALVDRAVAMFLSEVAECDLRN